VDDDPVNWIDSLGLIRIHPTYKKLPDAGAVGGGAGGGGRGYGSGRITNHGAKGCSFCGTKPKPVNLPSPKKLKIDMEHISSGHMSGGSRVSSRKTLFPSHMNNDHVRKAILEAYKNCKKMETQGNRVRLRGGTRDGIPIEMWLNLGTHHVETAYPIPIY
jgi:hypothetical protein